MLQIQESNKKILADTKLIRDNLNDTGELTEYKKITFDLALNSDELESRIKKIIFGNNIMNEYQSIKMDNGDYLIYTVDSIEYPENIEEVYKKDNEFSNFIINTRSESEYSLFQQILKSNANIEINENYINLD